MRHRVPGPAHDTEILAKVNAKSTPQALRDFLRSHPGIYMRGEEPTLCPLAKFLSIIIGYPSCYNTGLNDNSIAEWHETFAVAIDTKYGSHRVTAAEALVVLDELFPEIQ